MLWYHCVAYFFGGAFLANTLPHLINGISGSAFQSPFASPPGKGLSSSTVNVLWGCFNLAVAYVLICRVGSFGLNFLPNFLGRPCPTMNYWRSGSRTSRSPSRGPGSRNACTRSMTSSPNTASGCGRMPGFRANGFPPTIPPGLPFRSIWRTRG